MAQNKTGPITEDELNFIRANYEVMSEEEIASRLQRTVKTVQKYWSKVSIPEIKTGLYDAKEKEFIAKLRKKPFYRDLKEQFSDQEIELYEYHWVHWNIQLTEDVTHAEESQVRKVIELELIMRRNLIDRNKIDTDIERIDKILQNEFSKEPMERDVGMIDNLQHQLGAMRSSQLNRTKEYNDMITKHGSLLVNLKSTRDQRFKEIQTRKTTLFGWMKQFNDKIFREELSREAELYRLSKIASDKRLAEYHKFEDGMIDQILLSADTVKQDNNV